MSDPNMNPAEKPVNDGGGGTAPQQDPPPTEEQVAAETQADQEDGSD